MSDSEAKWRDLLAAQLDRLERTRPVPYVVEQALDDTRLPETCRLAMWHLRRRLDTVRYVEVKSESFALDMRAKERTVRYALDRLVSEGYLDEHAKQRPRAFRFPQCRLQRETMRAAA